MKVSIFGPGHVGTVSASPSLYVGLPSAFNGSLGHPLPKAALPPGRRAWLRGEAGRASHGGAGDGAYDGQADGMAVAGVTMGHEE